MTMAPDDYSSMVDQVFDLQGEDLPQDHREALWLAVSALLTWLPSEPTAGIHAIRAAHTNYGMTLLPRRAKLVLRVPEHRRQDAQALEGETLDVVGHPLRVGASHIRTLPLASTLYADFVSTGSSEETRFQADIARELARLGIGCRFICGRRRASRVSGSEVAGFAVALHDVPLDQSLWLQCVGLGRARHLGCGILIQHKEISGLH